MLSQNFRLPERRPSFSFNPRTFLLLLVLFAFSFAAGHLAARGVDAVKTAVLPESTGENWGLGFPTEGEPPVGNATAEELKRYNAYFMQNTDEKILYLTFDCGYENGNTPPILQALKKHNAPAAFFVVGNFIRDNPELVRQMVEDGHIVGNHTFSHPDMSQISTMEAFEQELYRTEELYLEATGQKMTKWYRPPRGIYSTENLKMAQELGYHTFFWSLAYVDWIQDDQPTADEAFDKLIGRIHPGAVVLLHNTSRTNAEILDDLLTQWEKMGYSFRSLEQLIQSQENV